MAFSISKQVLITTALLALTLVVFENSQLDIVVQDYLYDFTAQHWLLDRSQQPWKLLLYDGIKRLYMVGVLVLLISLIAFRKHPRIQAYKTGLLTVLLSSILVPLIIASLKAETNVPCPKDITRYNGALPHVTLFASWPPGTRPDIVQRCYPAAHASGGFALLSLFFLFKSRRNRRLAVAFALSVGWVTGFYKMLIGDHFLSHTIVSMLLAWLIILLAHAMVRFIMSRHTRPTLAS